MYLIVLMDWSVITSSSVSKPYCLDKLILVKSFKRYATSTIKTYKNALAKFLNAFEHKDLAQVNLEQIQDFFHCLQTKDRISPVYQIKLDNTC